jgi:L-aminopeptidase/D-esterase-like protein
MTAPFGGAPQTVAAVSDTDEASMNAIFDATVQATEEAIANQLIASQTMEGADGVRVYALPHERLVQSLKQHRRWVAPTGSGHAASQP